MQTHDSVAFQPGMNIFTDKGHQNSWNQSNISMLMKKKRYTLIRVSYTTSPPDVIILLAVKAGKHNSSLPDDHHIPSKTFGPHFDVAVMRVLVEEIRYYKQIVPQ